MNHKKREMLTKTDVMVYLRPPSGFQPQFSAVGTFCTTDNLFLLLRRTSGSTYPECWGIPGGKLAPDELPHSGAKRELFEETKIDIAPCRLTSRRTYFVSGADQAFTYYVFSADFERQPYVTLNHLEHTEFRWCTPDDALNLSLVDGLQLCLYDQRQMFAPRGHPTLDELESVPFLKRTVHQGEICPSLTPWWAALGAPAAGKTTGLNAMAVACPELSFVGCPEILASNSRLRSLLKSAFVEQCREAFFPFQMELLNVQFSRIRSLEQPSLVDESVYNILAYSRALYHMGWISPKEYMTLHSAFVRLHSLLQTPAGIFYFDSSIALLQQRLKYRAANESGRFHESLYDFSYLSALKEAFAITAIELSTAVDVTIINTGHNTPDEIGQYYAPCTCSYWGNKLRE